MIMHSITAQNNASLADRLSEIQSLKAHVEQLERSTGAWDSWYVKCAGFAVALAALAFFMQFVAHKRDVKLREASSRLLTLTQQATDLQIETARGETARVSERAGKLEIEASKLTEANLKLEALIAPRRLNESQQKALASLTKFAGRPIEVKSYSSDTEGAILATQVLNALATSNLSIRDNRLTMQPAGTISFGVSVEGPDSDLVHELSKILADLKAPASSGLSLPNRGFSARVSFGHVSWPTPPAAIIIVGVKPIK
jgi:hypothetical protein